jgi:hypothetical protein
LARYFFAGLRRGLLVGLLSCKARVRATCANLTGSRPSTADSRTSITVLPLLAFVHAAREGVDITPSVEERSKLVTVRQRDRFVELSFPAAISHASTSLPPIVPRERFGASRRDLLRVGDILIGQARANPRPCIPEFQFAVVEVGAGPPVVTALWSAVDVAGPYPLRPVVRCPAAEQDPADRHAAPDHGVIVSVALAGDCGGPER